MLWVLGWWWRLPHEYRVAAAPFYAYPASTVQEPRGCAPNIGLGVVAAKRRQLGRKRVLSAEREAVNTW